MPKDAVTTLTITGMTCEHCVSAVRSALENVTGVIRADVNLAEARAQVEGDAALSDLLAAVADEGYQATPG